MTMKKERLEELVLQSLEHEMGGVTVYETAIRCSINADLTKEWRKYLEQTRSHVAKLKTICAELGLNLDAETPGRKIIRALGESLVSAMKQAAEGGDAAAAQLVACECVVIAETKDHLDWELLRRCAEHPGRSRAGSLDTVVSEVEDEEDEHLYHSRGWCRELWIEALGMKAMLPPPEETRQVKTAIGAARAEQAAEKER